MQENYKILVVDDDMRLRALLERYLTEQGFQVRSVAKRRADGPSADSRILPPDGPRPDAAGRRRPLYLPPPA